MDWKRCAPFASMMQSNGPSQRMMHPGQATQPPPTSMNYPMSNWSPHMDQNHFHPQQNDYWQFQSPFHTTPAMPPVSRDMVCFRCMKGFMPQDKHISDRGNVFHSECFVCDVCKVPLWNTSNYACLNQKIYCYIHIPEPNSNPMMGAEVYDLSDIDMSISVHPANYQIANYNVHPSPKIVLSKPTPVEHTVNAALVELASGYELDEGFQTPPQKLLKPGGNCLIFSGLKLNKMGKIKNELRQHHIMRFDKFIIRFRLGKFTLDSQPFKLLSSCTQLPPDVKDVVRPSKKPHAKRMSIDASADIEEPLYKRSSFDEAIWKSRSESSLPTNYAMNQVQPPEADPEQHSYSASSYFNQ